MQMSITSSIDLSEWETTVSFGQNKCDGATTALSHSFMHGGGPVPQKNKKLSASDSTRLRYPDEGGTVGMEPYNTGSLATQRCDSMCY